MYNLNKGKNDELLIKCKPLSDYMELVNRIRQNQKNGMIVEAAVDRAVDSCIEDGILSEFLIGHRAEVRDMCITEFNEKVFVNGIRAEGIQEGIQQGLQQGAQQARIEAVENMIRANIPEQTIRSMGYTEEELSSAKQNISVLV
jgi:flagellar biosynthesis/type III secretory pathway protein FliH